MTRIIKFRIRVKTTYGERLGEINTYYRDIEDLIDSGFEHNAGTQEILSKDEWTGLLDKNGKEIYEGDVVHAIAPEAHSLSTGEYEIRWNEAEAAFDVWVIKNGELDKPFWHCVIEWWDSLEIIGNIYQDEHLLEK